MSKAIAADRSFVGIHSALTADGFCVAHENAIFRGDVFHFHFVSTKVQDFIFLIFCKFGIGPHFTLSADKPRVFNANSIFCGDVFQLRFVSAKIQYLINLFQSKFGVGVFSFVLGWCEWLQVIGVDAAAYTTEVMKLQSFWDRPDDNTVEIPMRASTVSKNFIFGGVTQKTIPILVKASNPNPARRTVASIFQHKSVRKFSVVSADVIFRLAFFISRSFFSLLRNRCSLAAPAFANPVIHTLTGHGTNIAWSVV